MQSSHDAAWTQQQQEQRQTQQQQRQLQQRAVLPCDSAAQFYTDLVQLQPQQQCMASGIAPVQDEPQLVPSQQEQQGHMLQQQQHTANHGYTRPISGSRRHSSASETRPAIALPMQVPVPFQPVRFSSRTHLLDPNTGMLTLPPKAAAADLQAAAAAAAAATSSSSAGLQAPQQQLLHATQPPHPAVPPQTASSKRPIDRGNLGYQLLAKAGWQEGQGLGAKEQGIAVPLAVPHNKGSLGLGFSKQQQPQLAAAGNHSSTAAQQPSGPAAAAAVAGPVLGSKRVAALVASELAAEDLDAKVKRHKQLQQQKVKEQRDKAIQTYLYRAFNDVDGPDSNPLLASSHRLTATNPLLD